MTDTATNTSTAPTITNGTISTGFTLSPQQTQAAVQTGQQAQQAGFPAETPVAEMTEAQQAAYWKAQSRKHEERASGRQDYDQIKSELESLKASTQTDTEKAINEAKTVGRNEALRDINAGAVKALLDGNLRMRGKSDADVATVLGALNVDTFVKDGVPDTQAIIAYASLLAPATGTSAGPGPDFGAGQRGNRPGVVPGAAGLSEAQKRFGTKQ